jgi:endonuclease-3
MQQTFEFLQTECEADLRFIKTRLHRLFGDFRFEDRGDPVSQLVGSLLSSRTHDSVSLRAFERLAKGFPDWDAVADAPQADILDAIGDVTFPEKKAADLKQALRLIRARFGRITLDFLNGLEPEQALFQLEQLPGIGRKTAAAILNFSSLRMRTFVVDTHVLRVLQRFGFLRERAETGEAYDAVMAAADGFDADHLFELHWHIKRLGQSVCSHTHAACDSCPLASKCTGASVTPHPSVAA